MARILKETFMNCPSCGWVWEMENEVVITREQFLLIIEAFYAEMPEASIEEFIADRIFGAK